LKIDFLFLNYTELSKAECFAHCELATIAKEKGLLTAPKFEDTHVFHFNSWNINRMIS